ncbi:hypothetical protein [Kitasatospora sp. NPDC004531]
MYVEWRRPEAGGLRQAQDSVLDRHRRTRRFRVHASRTIPGMVRTRAYTEAVLRHSSSASATQANEPSPRASRPSAAC